MGAIGGSRNSCKQPGLTEFEQNGRQGYGGLLPLADPHFHTDLQAHLFEDKDSNSKPYPFMDVPFLLAVENPFLHPLPTHTHVVD